MAHSTLNHQSVVVRSSDSSDTRALHRLAALDSQQLPAGPFMVAEVDGELVAAKSVRAGGRSVADPFRHTAGLLELLSLRVRHMAVAR